MLLTISILACAAAVIALLGSPYWGILITFAVNPIIAASWSYRFGEFTLNHVIGVAVPALILPRLHSQSVIAPNWQRWKTCAIVFATGIGFGAITLLAAQEYVTAAEHCVHAVNGCMAFLFLGCFFGNRQGLRHLLIALLLGGLFPVATGIYQALTGTIWYERTTIGLTRYVGLYHDAVAIKHFGLQTLLAILLYLTYMRPRQLLRMALLGYAACCLVVVFNVYSKSALAILAAWLLIWSSFTRKFVWASLVLAAVASLNWALDDILVTSVKQLFWKEIAYQAGEADRQIILAGRFFIWEAVLAEWSSKPLLEKLIGSGDFVAAHNEWLRILIGGGIVGLIISVTAIIMIGNRVLALTVRWNQPVTIVALMVYAMWLIECMGLHPGIYSYFMWFVWGIVGLAFALEPCRNRVRSGYQPGARKLKEIPQLP